MLIRGMLFTEMTPSPKSRRMHRHAAAAPAGRRRQRTLPATGELNRCLEVALLAALHADLGEGQGDEEAQVPGDEVEPELVGERRAGGEVRQLLADRLGQQAEEGLAAKGGHPGFRGGGRVGSTVAGG
jgi:hypothetical protein